MSAKRKDRNGRWRSRTVSFRASDDEIREINEMVSLSGLTKQEYIITKLLNRDIVVVGNPRVFVALKRKMQEIYSELNKLHAKPQVNNSLFQSINTVINLYSAMLRQNKSSLITRE